MLEQTLSMARKSHVPRIENVGSAEHGEWTESPNPDDAERLIAANRFLETANAIFSKAYTPNDLKATYYIDDTGHRGDIWRFDSKDGVLSGALAVEKLAFLSADCINESTDALHETLRAAAASGKEFRYWEVLDVTDAVNRIAALLGGTVSDAENRGGSGRHDATNGWMIKQEVLFALGDGRFCSINIYGDENLTPTTVCVFPDADCAEESVYWRADLERADETVAQLYPNDFREGEPGADDMTREEAIAFFDKLLKKAGFVGVTADEKPEAPTAMFYIDYSGARENYWHIEGSGIALELTSKTGRMLSLSANGRLGSKLGLADIPYEKMGEQRYVDATQALFVALFGKAGVSSVEVNAVYDDHYCTMDPKMADGTEYEIMYQDGLIVEVASFVKIDPNTWASVPEWLEKWKSVDKTTGEITIAGFENGTRRNVPNWLADWVYINNETGEIFAMEW